MKTIAFKNFGCRSNSMETDALILEGRRRGYIVCGEDEAADALVINSCTVTALADRDSRVLAQKYRRKNPQAVIAVVGCYAQVAKESILALSEVDLVVGSANKFQVIDLIEQRLSGNLLARDHVAPPTGFLPVEFPGSRLARAAIKVQDGCNYRCSFCIIPKARGRSRSLPLENIVGQVRTAYEMGFNEVVLTAIHLAHYGWDQGTDLVQLVRALVAEEEGPRIRLSTLDPFEIPDELLEMIGSESKLCPHFHIALQSGDDAVLARMRRLYLAKEFKDVSERIYRKHSDTFLGVDVIVGFPGEDQTSFENTLNLLRETYWSKLHVFSFSTRKATEAEQLDGHVERSVVAERSEILRDLSDRRYRSFLHSQVGKTKDALVERTSKKHPGFVTGHTENYIPVRIKSSELTSKSMIQVEIDEILEDGTALSSLKQADRAAAFLLPHRPVAVPCHP